jgi:hypothetical protein
MTPDFFHPLTLGIRPVQKPDDAPQSTESVRPRIKHALHAEAQVFNRFLQAAYRDPSRLWVVLGEAGAGKSWLMEDWFRRWVAGSGSARLGIALPVLVRLRNIKRADLALSREALADRLWELGLRERALLGVPGETAYRSERKRFFRAAWLLDGLDEIPDLVSPDLFAQLADLPGAKLLTCRDNILRSYRSTLAPYQEPSAEYEILPLPQTQWLAFLRGRLGDSARAAELTRTISNNRQLSEIAGNPLILDLIAELHGDPAVPITLPASLPEFYRQVVSHRWNRKLFGNDRRELQPSRDRVLAALAGKMQVTKAQTDLSHLDAALAGMPSSSAKKLATALETSGLLVIDYGLDQLRFPHFRFQEYYLALALAPQGCAAAVMTHWHDHRFEAPLALLLSMSALANDKDAVASALIKLVKLRKRFGRSPLRSGLHLLKRSGVTSVADKVFQIAAAPDLLRLALSGDEEVPPEILAGLACDPLADVRCQVAANRTTAYESLAKLAHDADTDVRANVALNSAAPSEILTKLARDRKGAVRANVALNEATPSEILAELARDRRGSVRGNVALNSAALSEVLTKLARDGYEQVRANVALNQATPSEVLAELARDPDLMVQGDADSSQREKAENAEKFFALARSSDKYDRWHAALSPNTPRETLGQLARDSEWQVRGAVAYNKATSLDILAELAHDHESNVRAAVAFNETTASAILTGLARDPDEDVRASVAHNKATLPEALAELARTELARDPRSRVRALIARNEATPPWVLTIFAIDPQPEIRLMLARNEATPRDTLAKLARDRDRDVRLEVAENRSAPCDALAKLARDRDEVVRQTAALHEATLLEDLTAARPWYYEFCYWCSSRLLGRGNHLPRSS